MPQRIQMSRSHPWRAEHPDAVIVDRRTKWGNPFRVVQSWRGGATGGYVYRVRPEPSVALHRVTYTTERQATERAVHLYRQEVIGRIERGSLDVSELAGRDLACWCPLPVDGEPDICHAAILLSIANHTPAPAGVSAAPTSRDRPIGPAGAPIPTTSEEQCERCGRILDCCRHCPVHEGDVDE